MQNEKFYYISYAALPGLVFLFCTLYAIGVFHATIKSSLNIHMNVIQSLLNASSSFFDQNPSGQIFDRMSKDIEALDVALPDTLVPTLNSVITILVVFTLMVVTYPLLLIVFIICAIVFFSLQRCYRCSARSFKRLSASNRGNVLSFLSDSISGAVVIKSQGRRDLFVAKMTQKYDNYNKTIYLLNESQRWLASRVDFMGSIMLVLATVGGIFYERMFSKDLSSLGNNIGFILTCSVSIVEILYWCIIQSVDVDINLTSVERLEYYHKSISHESEHVYHVDAPSKRATLSMEKVHIEESNSIDELIDERSPAIEFSNVWLKYRPDLPFILKGINMRIAPGQKIGLVGRTGSGKSTIIQALFRFVDVHDDEQSVVRVFGCDVREMPLRSLRTLLTVIPQDPTLFSGTIRTNIDPLGERTDSQIWEALKGAHLASHFSTLDDGIEAGGSNLSQGQRQLVCLARALVRKSRILVLDEATASVDVDADAKIQAAIAENCRDVTVVTIAHRLETVMKTDNVFVLSDGAVVESGNPLELIRDSNSLFCRMARSH